MGRGIRAGDRLRLLCRVPSAELGGSFAGYVLGSAGTLGRTHKEAKKGFAPFCPDFVGEIVSLPQTGEELQQKMREYRYNGARLGWLIDPKSRRVEIYRPGLEVEMLDNPTSLSGEDILPGFTLDLKGILE